MVIANGSRLRELNLSYNENVSPAAWQVLTIALRLHAPALEMLSLSRAHSGLIASLTGIPTDKFSAAMLPNFHAF
jgi:hypothetical protein